VRDVIAQSGLLKQFPEIDIDTQKVGIFGKLTKLDAVVEDGSRIEIYRPITADPELVERRDLSDE
jgi:putative ubiquitin-RnfH superfamily antitoxin RatB of RatAB toxin-antitoxin module